MTRRGWNVDGEVKSSTAWTVAVAIVLLAGACSPPSAPEDAVRVDAVSLAGVTMIRMTGSGQIGDGLPGNDSINLQVFDLDAGMNGALPYGRLDYTDYSVIKPDGNPARLRAGPDEPGTAITGFVQTSSVCVEISGRGRVVNTDEIVSFLVETCDNGSPGVGRDVFGIRVPERFLTHGTPYQRGPDMLSDGELTATYAAV